MCYIGVDDLLDTDKYLYALTHRRIIINKGIRMNAATKLLNYLDDYFGFKKENPKLRSVVKKISQSFDEKASVHVITFEYRCKSYAGGRVTKKIKENSLLRSILR